MTTRQPTRDYQLVPVADKPAAPARVIRGRAALPAGTRGDVTVEYTEENKTGVNVWGWVFYICEILAALTAVAVGSAWAKFSYDQGEKTPRYGWYPLIFTVADTENYSNYDVRIGMIFFVTLAVSGGAFLVLQGIALLTHYTSSDKMLAWSPIHKYAFDMQTMGGWYDGLRYAGTFWAPYTVAFILVGTREIPSLAYSGLLVIITYLLRLNAGINRKAYRESVDEQQKASIRANAAWMFIIGFAIHVIIFTLLMIQYSFRLDKDIPFSSKSQGFILLVGIGGFVEYWLVFGMRSSSVFKDIKFSCSEAPYAVVKMLSLSWIYHDCCKCFTAEKYGVMLGWVAHAISRTIEFTIWIAGGILMYEGGVKKVFVA